MDTGLYQDTVTVYTALGEDTSGRMAWLRTVVEHVTVFRYDGAKQYPARTLEGDDRATVYFHLEHMRSPVPYVEEAAFDTLADKTAAWTIRADGNDRLVIGVSDAAKPPTGPEQYRPLVVNNNNKGSPRMRHLEVVCK